MVILARTRHRWTAHGTDLEVVIRTVEEYDAIPILEIIDQIRAEGDTSVSEPGEPSASAGRTIEWIQQHRENDRYLALVATAEGEVIGLVHFENGALRRLAHKGTLGISVTREWRGRGVGRRLMERLIEWGRATDGVDKIALAVLADNRRAIALYQSLGFRTEGRRPAEVRRAPGEYVDDILMYIWVGDPALVR
ncbi:MAG: GNAT family N-acetyltransferase [Planctomycetes bacterium]|nr:GNAT family N-acetyltransferase [Planctomycetota bacterium]